MKATTFFLPYQKKWIADDSRLKIMEKSRQIGITMSTAYRLVRLHASEKFTFDSWVSSRDELQAKLFINDCRNFANIFQSFAKLYGMEIFEQKTCSFSITFSNGSSINSLSSSPDAQAGKRGTRILDEFALHQDPKQLFIISLPGITWGGQLEIVSTHRGSNNFFNALISDIRENGNPKKFSHHRVTLEDALNQGFLTRLQSKLSADDPRKTMTNGEYFDHVKSSCPDDDSFMQEYMCQPNDDRSAFLSYELIDGCTFSKLDDWALSFDAMRRSRYDFCLGVDVGRDHDLTVMWLLEIQEGFLFTRRVICLKNEPFASQERALCEFAQLPNLRRICIDQTGIGRQFYERACECFGKYTVEGITFTNSAKEQLAYRVRTAFENCLVKIPNDDYIRADMRAIKREITFAGNVRFAADRGKNGHADRFWALALAIHASAVFKNSAAQFFESLAMERYSRNFKY
ncbi:MAG: terminase family protein [Puniceicoccales bacterium]|jgi:phage FluMu gp28-like protein|nr:terminase family protein [Puniceicoccales bacterium]